MDGYSRVERTISVVAGPASSFDEKLLEVTAAGSSTGLMRNLGLTELHRRLHFRVQPDQHSKRRQISSGPGGNKCNRRTPLVSPHDSVSSRGSIPRQRHSVECASWISIGKLATPASAMEFCSQWSLSDARIIREPSRSAGHKSFFSMRTSRCTTRIRFR